MTFLLHTAISYRIALMAEIQTKFHALVEHEKDIKARLRKLAPTQTHILLDEGLLDRLLLNGWAEENISNGDTQVYGFKDRKQLTAALKKLQEAWKEDVFVSIETRDVGRIEARFTPVPL